jgi:hypothetical protein
MNERKRILVLAPHTDDGAFGIERAEAFEVLRLVMPL